MADRRLLILGGTAEALALAGRLHGRDGWRVETALAGRTDQPVRPAGDLRLGGFDGAEGLARHLRQAGVAALVDATHPFAARISANAARAGRTAGVPVLHLLRPPWRPAAGDRWIAAADPAAAVARLSALDLEPGAAVLLTLGSREVAGFARLDRLRFVIRSIAPPAGLSGFAQATVIRARGPFPRAEEETLFADHRIRALVSRNSGGTATLGKIEAARAAGLPVIMLDRPPPPEGHCVSSPDQVVRWLRRIAG